MATFYSFPAGFGETERALMVLNAPAVMAVERRAHYDAADALMRALAAMQEQLILNFIGFGMGAPMPETEEAMREWFAAYGIELPANMPSPTTYLTTQRFLNEAKTLRQRCFAWLFNGYNDDTGMIRLLTTADLMAKRPEYKIHPFRSTLRSLMAACSRDKEVRKVLSELPISRGGSVTNSNPELVEPLQDLADIVTYEVRQAYEADYFPGIPDVDPLTDEHVDEIMVAMQREIDREQRVAYGAETPRNKYTAHLPDLPRDRKTALAERRRHWFGVFGITPKSWRRGTWSLWKVKNVPYPEGYKRHQY